jgi:hypothetical protein
MKSMEVFSEDSSKYVTFDIDSASTDNAVIGEVQRWLSRRTGRVLLVLDNVQRQNQLNSILTDRAIHDKSFVLLTSRRRDLRVAESFGVYDMQTMNDTDALQLLRWHSQGPGSAGVIKTRALKV